MKRKGLVIDTNVSEVADGERDKASRECIEACSDALEDAKLDLVLVDDKYLILNEYEKQPCVEDPSGADGGSRDENQKPLLGRLFYYKRLLPNLRNPDVCRQVSITPRGSDGDFEEFPDSQDLEGFDKNDRKFVAVALASRMDPTILNASDSDWWEHGDALEANGVRVRNLCPDLIQDGN